MIDDAEARRLARYLAGECAPEEAAELRRRIDRDPELQEALAFMRDVRAAAKDAVPAWDTDEAWQRLAARKVARERRPALSPHLWSRPRTSERRRLALRAAAALLLVAGGIAAWMLRDRWSGAPAVARGPALREHVTARGERATIRLADGSRIVLAADSRIRYAEPFGQHGRREIHLEGEALFEVEHDERRPFYVSTRRGITEDLGTRFSVQEYPADSAVRVVVAEGRVELRHAGAPPGRGALLTAGQLASLGPGGTAVVRSAADVARLLSWTEGTLVFEDAPVAEVLAQLSRWYDLDFVLADPALGARTLTATFAGEAIRPTLQLLGSALGVRYEQVGRRVTLYPQRLSS